jgi:hypothetical protein
VVLGDAFLAAHFLGERFAAVEFVYFFLPAHAWGSSIGPGRYDKGGGPWAQASGQKGKTFVVD